MSKITGYLIGSEVGVSEGEVLSRVSMCKYTALVISVIVMDLVVYTSVPPRFTLFHL